MQVCFESCIRHALGVMDYISDYESPVCSLTNLFRV